MNCRHCGTPLGLELIDMGTAPPSNAYIAEADLKTPEKWYPLRVFVCEKCWLAQTEDFTEAEELFSSDYSYFSSFSTTWLKHAEDYVDMIARRLKLGSNSHVVEIAANDGYLLQYVKRLGIHCLGIEPTHAAAMAARRKGIEIVEDFFGLRLANQLVEQEEQADLIVANNVFAHVPDINDFVSGCARLLRKNGVATFEFQYLVSLIQHNQFDTIYHEHFSYLSLTAATNVLSANALTVFDVERLSTHGGSLRIYAQRSDSQDVEKVSDKVRSLLMEEKRMGVLAPDFYEGFNKKAQTVKNDFVSYLIDAKRQGLRVAAYGAAAKGNTLLNYAGVRKDLLPYVVDLNPSKQGKYLPGSRIPIVSEDHLSKDRPDRIFLLPWNIKDEIMIQLAYARNWGAKVVIAVPQLEIA